MRHLFWEKRLRRYRVCGENGVPAGEVRESPRRACDLSLFDAAGKPAGRVCRDGETLVIEGTCAGTFSCPLQYKTDAAGRRVQKTLVRPPMAERVEAKTAFGDLAVCQTPARAFRVSRNGQSAGTVRGLAHRHGNMDLQESLPPGAALVLFAVCVLLFHDDDLEIV